MINCLEQVIQQADDPNKLISLCGIYPYLYLQHDLANMVASCYSYRQNFEIWIRCLYILYHIMRSKKNHITIVWLNKTLTFGMVRWIEPSKSKYILHWLNDYNYFDICFILLLNNIGYKSYKKTKSYQYWNINHLNQSISIWYLYYLHSLCGNNERKLIMANCWMKPHIDIVVKLLFYMPLNSTLLLLWFRYVLGLK